MSNPIVQYILQLDDQASAPLGDHGKAVEDTGKKTEETTKKTKAGTAALKKYGAAALVGATAFIALMQSIADTRNQITDMSTRTGIAAETLNGLKLAADGSGLSLDSLERTLARFPQVMGEAAEEGSAAADAFDRLGVSVTDSTGSLRDADTVFREAIAAIGAIEDPTKRAAAAADLFGTSGTKLLQALGDPSALNAFIDQANRFGTDVGPAAAKAAGDWERAMADLKLAIAGAVDDVGGALGGVTELIDNLAVGIIFMSTLASQFIDNVIKGFNIVKTMGPAVVDFLRTGDREVFNAVADSLPGGVDPEDMVKNALDEAFAFWNNQKATRGGAGIPGVPSGGSGGGSGGSGGGSGGSGGSGGEDLPDISFLSLEEAALRDFEEAFGPVVDVVLHTAEKGEGLRSTLEGLGLSAGRLTPALEGFELTMIDLDLGFQRGVISAQEYEQALADIERIQRDTKLTDFMGSAGFQAGSSLMTGDVMGALGAGLPAVTGEPVSTAILTSIQLLTTIGEQGTAAIVEQIEAFKDTLLAGIEALPELLPALVSSLIEMIPDLVEGLVKAIPDLIAGLMEASRELTLFILTELPLVLLEAIGAGIGAVWDMIKPSWWGTPFSEIARGVWEALRDWWGGVKETIAGWFSLGGTEGEEFFAKGNTSLGRTLLAIGTLGASEAVGAVARGIGGYAEGGYVPRTQLAVVHQGERVVARNGAVSGGARKNLGLGQSSGVNVNINASVVDRDAIPRLVREIERAFGDYGRASSYLFD